MKVIAWVFMVFGGLMLLAAINALYTVVFENSKPVGENVGAVFSPALFGAVFLSVGLKLRKKYNK